MGYTESRISQLHTQAMNYEENAPRDYPTYYRDVRLYYQDLMAGLRMAIEAQALDDFRRDFYARRNAVS